MNEIVYTCLFLSDFNSISMMSRRWIFSFYFKNILPQLTIFVNKIPKWRKSYSHFEWLIFIYCQTLRQMLTRIFIHLTVRVSSICTHTAFIAPHSFYICWSTKKSKPKRNTIITTKHATWAKLSMGEEKRPQNPMSCGEGWKENPDFIVETRQIKCCNFGLCLLYYVVWVY